MLYLFNFNTVEVHKMQFMWMRLLDLHFSYINWISLI